VVVDTADDHGCETLMVRDARHERPMAVRPIATHCCVRLECFP
jgi:hypothetical protein